MNHLELLFSFLIALFSSQTVPVDQAGMWVASQNWVEEDDHLVFSANSNEIIELCRQQKDRYILTPLLVQGVHELWLDGDLIAASGDSDFKEASSYYNSLTVSCSQIAAGSTLEWRAFTKTKSVAVLNHFPKLVSHIIVYRFFYETLNLMFSGAFIILGFICFFLFMGKIALPISFVWLMGSISFSVAFLLYCPDAIGLSISPFVRQQFADSGLWLGTICVTKYFNSLGFLQRGIYRLSVSTSVVGLIIIWNSSTLDQIQVGSNIAIVGASGYVLGTLLVLSDTIRGRERKIEDWLKVSTLLIFASSIVNDILLFFGLLESVPLFPGGVLSSFIFSAFVVNSRIQETFKERDYLRKNLEREVQLKTKKLEDQTRELSDALASLKAAQAELIQSAKLASLGTLSAGIAHEINNAINYVSGALPGLERLIQKNPDEEQRKKAKVILDVMREGTQLTIDIVRSLRSYTGVNHSKHKDVHLEGAIRSILTILRRKIAERSVAVEVEIPSELRVFTDLVSLNQILMNLLTNSIDSVGDKGLIKISAKETESGVWFSIQDNGSGIPEDLRDRIFDPFFTTKDVGAGTGLGLYIVQKEVKRLEGRIEVESEVGRGTTFKIFLPRNVVIGGAAA